MRTYTVAVDGCIDQKIAAEDDEGAKQAAIDHLLLSLDVACSRRQLARLLRDDGSDVWMPDTVVNLVS